jgi:hypothetical protein
MAGEPGWVPPGWICWAAAGQPSPQRPDHGTGRPGSGRARPAPGEMGADRLGTVVRHAPVALLGTLCNQPYTLRIHIDGRADPAKSQLTADLVGLNGRRATGGPHHEMINLGHLAAAWRVFCQLAGIEFIQGRRTYCGALCAHTTHNAPRRHAPPRSTGFARSRDPDVAPVSSAVVRLRRHRAFG